MWNDDLFNDALWNDSGAIVGPIGAPTPDPGVSFTPTDSQGLGFTISDEPGGFDEV